MARESGKSGAGQSVAADLERLADVNETLSRTCERLRLELLEARHQDQHLQELLQARRSG
jgi:hypothetical protein